VSMVKLSNARTALAIAREARSVLGATGITFDAPVIRHMNNLESVITYEGTEEIHTLIVGAALTGFRAFG
jgi:glutaryl-CoA dehydrogenase